MLEATHSLITFRISVYSSFISLPEQISSTVRVTGLACSQECCRSNNASLKRALSTSLGVGYTELVFHSWRKGRVSRAKLEAHFYKWDYSNTGKYAEKLSSPVQFFERIITSFETSLFSLCQLRIILYSVFLKNVLTFRKCPCERECSVASYQVQKRKIHSAH